MDTGLPVIYNLADEYPNVTQAISSLEIVNGYIVSVYTGTGLTGDRWVFRGPIKVSNMDSYVLNGFNFNDQIQSIQAQPQDTYAAGATLFQNSNLSGLSYYFAAGSYLLSDFPIGSETTSSLIVYGLANAILTGTHGYQTCSNYSNTYTAYNSVKYNDNAVYLTVQSLGTD